MKLADYLEYAGMVALVISVGAFDWRFGGIVLAAALIFISYAMERNNDSHK
jgi:hypothetical protein